MKKPRDTIKHVGQRYVDKEIIAQPVGLNRSHMLVADALSPGCQRPLLGMNRMQAVLDAMKNDPDVHQGRSKPIPTGLYQRVRLRWMKPDGKGGLIPKYKD